MSYKEDVLWTNTELLVLMIVAAVISFGVTLTGVDVMENHAIEELGSTICKETFGQDFEFEYYKDAVVKCSERIPRDVSMYGSMKVVVVE